MQAFVALLRGINVGGRNKLPMKDLVALIEGMSLENVRAYIQSGNVVFQAPEKRDPALAIKIGDAIVARCGFRPELIILDKTSVDTAISENPFSEAYADPTSVHLTFLSAPPVEPDLDALEQVRKPSERFSLKEQVFYLHAPDGIGRSKLAARIERSLGVSGTSRNWRTVLKLQEMMQACP